MQTPVTGNRPVAIMNTMQPSSANASLLLVSRLLSGKAGPLQPIMDEIAGTLGLSAAGLIWPIPGKAQIQAIAGDHMEDDGTEWGPDLVTRLMVAGSTNEAFIDASDFRRALVPLPVDGRRNGVFWAIDPNGIAEEDLLTLTVVAQALLRHPAFVDKLGPSLDSTRISQRLNDAAQVAGKIAHDFDNVFTGVVGFGEMVQGLLEPGTVPHQYVSEIVAAGNRGIAFTSQLHQLSRSGIARPMPATVSQVLSREEQRLRKLPNLQAKLQFASPGELPPVAVDSAALQQVLGHLLDNAVEASPPGGAVRVAASLIELSSVEASDYLGAVTPGPYVEIRVADEGPVIRDDYRKKLFVEPFFTTKVRHRGLGLPVALRILTAHRGGARYEAGTGRGSIFHVVLPLCAARAPEPGAASLDITRIPGDQAS